MLSLLQEWSTISQLNNQWGDDQEQAGNQCAGSLVWLKDELELTVSAIYTEGKESNACHQAFFKTSNKTLMKD